MKITKGEMAVFGIALAAFLVGACFYPYLPERMASHWNARGEVDGYMSKAWGAFLMPIVILGLGLLFMVIVRIDPLKANIAKFRKYYDGFIILFSVFLFCLNLWMLLWNIGYKFSMNIVIPIGIGLLIFYLGILCENTKRNWFIGIRTPWTLSSDVVWARTHRIGGILFKAVGIVILAGAFWPAYLLWFILIPTVLVSVFLLVYSYVVYQKVGQIGDSAGSLNDASGNGTWDSVKTGYLDQVEKALALAGHREKKQVLEDVRSHLDQRFSELAFDEQTWENMQTIITEMGPASDYAELLESNTLVPRPGIRLRHLLWISVIIIVVAGAVFLPNILAPKVGYIVSFRLPQMYKDITSRELLDKFNQVCPPGLRTHHYRTQIQGNNLVGFIVVDTEEDKASLYNALLESKELMPLTVRSVTQKEFEKHCALGQPSLKSEDDQTEPIGSEVPPMVVATTPVAFANDASPDLRKITVTFDQSMMNLSWSWIGGGETFPEMMGEPRYDKSKRTCILPVKLEPGRFYWVGINSPQHKNFQTDMHVAAVPYVILFATMDENGEPTPIPENFLEEARLVNSAHGELVAVDSARRWLGFIDDGDYGASWEAAADIFKNAATKEGWENMAKMVREPLGKVISREVLSKMPTQTVPGGPDGEYVIIQFKTSFENKADPIETVTPMLDKDGIWRVSGYYIK